MTLKPIFSDERADTENNSQSVVVASRSIRNIQNDYSISRNVAQYESRIRVDVLGLSKVPMFFGQYALHIFEDVR
jgi:hypothetical protein